MAGADWSDQSANKLLGNLFTGQPVQTSWLVRTGPGEQFQKRGWNQRAKEGRNQRAAHLGSLRMR